LKKITSEAWLLQALDAEKVAWERLSSREIVNITVFFIAAGKPLPQLKNI
jgi:hypothetical protein